MSVIRYWVAAALAALSTAALAGEPPKPLFATDAPLHLTIRGPIGQLASNRNEDKVAAATLSVDGAAPEALAVTLAPRGITRRAHDICTFPPLRVEFTQAPPAGSLFAGQKRLKLVTHCQSDADFQQYLLLEYSAYKMYNLLTPLSFDVRLATIDYVNANGKIATTRLGFFLEDSKDIGRRNGLYEAKVGARIQSAALSHADVSRAAMFEYLVGNLDFAFNAGPAGTDCCHNGRLFGPAGATTNLIAVPYDFDFSGMVDAPYATPPQGIPLPNVRVRQFRGFCRYNADARAAAADFTARRAALLGVLNTTPGLTERTRAKASAYLDHFFDAVATPQALQDNLLKTCI